MDYPVNSPDDWHEIGNLSLVRRMLIAFGNTKRRRRARKWGHVSLRCIQKSGRSLRNRDIVLLCVLRNAFKYVPTLLDHYRRLGVTRFAFVDDKSTDATRELLASASDVDLYESDLGYRQAGAGMPWRDLLVDIYGRNRWYVSIDSDEYLIYPGCEDRLLGDFIADLDRHGRKRAMAAMIDIYPNGPLSSLSTEDSVHKSPEIACPMFDGDGYTIEDDPLCTAVRGGPRLRIFGVGMRLTKFPVIFVDGATRFTGGTPHAPLPLERNYSPVNAILLHHKFPAGAVDDFKEIVARGSHSGGSRFYKEILNHDDFHEEADLRYDRSERFRGSDAMVGKGYMQDLRECPS